MFLSSLSFSHSLSQSAVVLGGCVVLATAGFAGSAQAAPKTTKSTIVQSANTPKSRITARTTATSTTQALSSKTVADAEAQVAWQPVRAEKTAGDEADEDEAEGAVEALPDAPRTGSTPAEKKATARLAQAGTTAEGAPTGNTPAAAPAEDQGNKKTEVPVGKEGDNEPEKTVVIEAQPGEMPNLPPAGESTPGVTIPGETVLTPTPDTGEMTLTPADAEGKEIATVRVVGNRVVSGDTILLAATGVRPGAAFSSRQAQLDLRKIRDLGFFVDASVQVTPNLQDPEKVDVTFVVIENRVVTGFRFENSKEVKEEDLREALVSKTGSLLNANNVNEDVKKIQGVYSERGFAALVTDVKQDDDGTVVYTIQEGVISKIELAGLKKTKPSIVRSVIRSKPGDPFNEKRIQKDLNNIYDTNFFEDVTYKVADDPETPGALIVTITVKEKRTGQFSVGFGFDSRSKISGFVGVSESNFKGTGKNVSAQVELGSQRSFNVGIGDRFVGSRNATYQLNLFSTRIYREPRSVERLIGTGVTGDEQQFLYQEERTGARFNYTLPLDLDRTRNVLFGYRNERVKLFLTGDDDTVPVDLPADSSGGISAFSIGFLRDKRDLRIDPSRGGRELLLLEQGVSFLGGTTSFTKADIDLRRYFPIIGPDKRGERPKLVFASRLVIGQSIGQLPAFEQYFIGGSETVRGYDADEQFGDNQVYGNMELRYRFQNKFQFVAFMDAGSAYGGRFSSTDSFEALFGYGVGVRLQTPIGPVRLDLAKGSGGGGFKTHFGIGSSF
jgi:outer membrane protein insertion porin family